MKNYVEKKERITDILQLYNALLNMFDYQDVSVDYDLQKPLVDTGWIKLHGKEVAFDTEGIMLLIYAGKLASITDVCSNTDGNLTLTFTFHGIVEPLDQSIPEKYQWLTERVVALSIAKQLLTIPLPNKIDRETLDKYVYAIDSIMSENDGWDVRYEAVDEENLKISFRCQYMQMVYGEDYYYYLAANSKSAGVRYISEDEFEVFFVFGNK